MKKIKDVFQLEDGQGHGFVRFLFCGMKCSKLLKRIRSPYDAGYINKLFFKIIRDTITL